MKPFLIPLLPLLFLLLAGGASAIPFLNYSHDAFWNETAEVGTPTSRGWVGSGVNYTTLQFFNGSKSVNATTNAGQYVLINSTLTPNYNVTIYFRYPSTAAQAGSTWGIRNITGNCGGDGFGICIGSRSVTSAANFVTLINNVWSATTVPLSNSWHVAEYRVTNTYNYNVTLDGVVVATGVNNNIGNVLYFNMIIDTGAQIYFDDLHAWNATVVPTPTPGLVLQLNNSRENVLIGNFSWNYTTTNASDTAAKTGFCSSNAGCVITNATAREMNFTIFNVSGNSAQSSFFNTTLRYNFNVSGGANVTAIAHTFQNYLNLSVNNVVNASNVSGFTIKMTNGSVSYDLYTASASLIIYNVIGSLSWNWTNISGNTYFDINGSSYASFNTTLNVTNTTYQGLAFVQAFRLFLNTTVQSFNVTNNKALNTTSTGFLYVPLLLGQNNLSVAVAGNYTQNYTCTLNSVLSTSYCNATNIYDTIYSFQANDTYNNVLLQNFTLTFSNSSLGGVVVQQNTTNGSLNISLLQGYTYYVSFVSNESYEYRNATLPTNASSHYYKFSVLPAPSINISIRSAATGNLITENITIVISSNATGQTVYTTTGGYFAVSLQPGEYSIKLFNANYSQQQYTLTLSGGYVYYLTAYLQQNASEVIMQFVDSIASSIVLPDTLVSQQLLVNGTWSTISTRTTDITGRTVFGYLDGVQYRFIALHDGYQTKQFDLDPVLFNTYTIKLERSSALDIVEDYQGISLTYNPSFFYNGQQNQLNMTFNSPAGRFTSYNYTITYPGGSKTGGGYNSVGQTLTSDFNISGATYFDKVNINLTYVSNGVTRQFQFQHTILLASTNTTFISNKNNTYGLGLLDRVIIGTIILLVAAGLMTLAGGGLFGIVMALFIMGVFTYIGFWEWWLAGISFLMGFVFVARRTT